MAAEKPEARYRRGDKVLCYEPDPVKQPIIYHSAILVRLANIVYDMEHSVLPSLLFNMWWCYTGWVKRVIFTFLSYYITLFFRITSSFWYYFHTFGRIASPFWNYFPTFSHVTSLFCYYELFCGFHCAIFDSSKPRITLGWIRNIVNLGSIQEARHKTVEFHAVEFHRVEFHTAGEYVSNIQYVFFFSFIFSFTRLITLYIMILKLIKHYNKIYQKFYNS